MYESWRDFGRYISVVAIQHAATSIGTVVTVFWFSVFVLLAAITAYQTVGYVLQFQSYGVITDVKIKTYPEKPFPAVTICNNNPYKWSQAKKIPDFKNLMDELISKDNAIRVASEQAPLGRKKRAGKAVTCPSGFSSDSTYPNLCYKWTWVRDNWNVSLPVCPGTYTGSTFPIFRDGSEYIAYSRWLAAQSGLLNYYGYVAYLGIAYNSTVQNYTWMDGTPISWNLFLPTINATPGYWAWHYMEGASRWDINIADATPAYVVCQIRLYEAVPPTLLSYPTSPICPPGSNWFFDNSTNICYYYDWKQSVAGWPGAQTFCQSLAPQSCLPSFNDISEQQSYCNLMKSIQITSVASAWIGYIVQNYGNNVTYSNGSAVTFSPWDTSYPTSTSATSYVCLRGWWPGWQKWRNQPVTTGWYFLCQYRPLAPNQPCLQVTATTSGTPVSSSSSTTPIVTSSSSSSASTSTTSSSTSSTSTSTSSTATSSTSTSTSSTATSSTSTSATSTSTSLSTSATSTSPTSTSTSSSTSTSPSKSSTSSTLPGSSAGPLSGSTVAQSAEQTAQSAEDFTTLIRTTASYGTQDPQVLIAKMLAILTDVQSKIPYVAAQLSECTRSDLGYKYEDIFIDCTFNGKPCGKADFVEWSDPATGNCFTFNHRDGNQFSTGRAGSEYGLRLFLNTSEKDYMPSSESNTVKVIINYNQDTIFVDSETHSVPPMHMLDLPLDYISQTSLSAPYGDCVDSKPDGNYIFDGEYSVEGCLKTCYQKVVVQKCGCAYPVYALPKKSNKFCNLNEKPCVDLIMNNQMNCTCHKKCHEQIYKSIPVLSKLLNYRRFKSKTIAALNVYHEQMRYFDYTEIPSYELINFYTDFCNAVGTNLNICIISVVEMIFLICFMLAQCAKTFAEYGYNN